MPIPADVNPIEQTLMSLLGSEVYAKFKQVLDYTHRSIYVPLYSSYNDNLQKSLNDTTGDRWPHDEVFRASYVRWKIMFYSFRFVSNIGKLIIQKHLKGDDKAEKYFVMLIKALLYHGLIAKGQSANFALVELEQLCCQYNMTLSELYLKYRKQLLRIIIKAILQKILNNSETGSNNGSADVPISYEKTNPVIDYITKAFLLFDVVKLINDDIAEALIIIAKLALKEKYQEPIKLFLEQLAAFERMDVLTLIRTHIQTIMVNLFLRQRMSRFDIEASMTKICSFFGKSLSDILDSKLTAIKARLVLHYSINPGIVAESLYCLNKFDTREVNEELMEGELEEEQCMIEYLQPSMIGILLGVDLHFTNNARYLGTEESLKHIESLTKIVSLLNEKLVQKIFHKLLSTLNLLTNLRPTRDSMGLNVALVNLWDVFLRKLDGDLRDTLMISICVALYDLVHDCPQVVSKLYNLLLSDNQRPGFTEKLKCLFFIPRAQGLETVYDQLTPYVIREKVVPNFNELLRSLDAVLPLTKFENRKCHQLALMRMRELLKHNQDQLINGLLINIDEPLGKVISRTVEALLSLSSSSDSSFYALIAECLGKLGAVNPIRFDRLIFGEIDSRKAVYVSDLSSPGFIVDLIERLKNSLISDKGNESEVANYALQVIISRHKVLTNAKLRERLSDAAIRACEICQHTHYISSRRIPPDTSVPIYIRSKRDKQYSYKEWLDKFSLSLISLLDDPKAQDVLHACTYTFKFNYSLAEYLLPLIIAHIVLNQPAKAKIVERELKAIVSEEVGVSTQDLDTVYMDDVRTSIETLHLQCANMVFCVLDELEKLEREIFNSLAPQTNRTATLVQTPNHDRYEKLRAFNTVVPRNVLATLAYKCRAYTRSLRYFDQYFYQRRNWLKQDCFHDDENEAEKYWTELQKVYVALDDVYEAASVEMIRNSHPTMLDDIANYESSGRLDRAFTCYNTMLYSASSTEPSSSSSTNSNTNSSSSCHVPPLIEDALKCLSNSGDHHRLYEKSKQLIDDYPQIKRGILPAAIEACWKIGKWDELDYTIKGDIGDCMLDKTPISQGLLLTSLYESRADTHEKLEIIRNRMMKPLSIAMMDRSAYFRGYQNLLVLHTIEDFDIAMKVLDDSQYQTQLLDENTTDQVRNELNRKLDSLILTWQKRSRLVQPSLKSLEPLLDWQRAILLILARKYSFMRPKLNVDVGYMWLSSADLAQEAKCYDRSFYCLSQARKSFGEDIHKLSLDLRVKYTIGQAKLDWNQGEQTRAIRGLKLSIRRLSDHGLHKHLKERRELAEALRLSKDYQSHNPFPELNNPVNCPHCEKFDLSERKSFSQLMILLTRYCEEAAAEIPESLLYKYEECVHLGVNQEETYLCLARYYDKLAIYHLENHPKTIDESKSVYRRNGISPEKRSDLNVSQRKGSQEKNSRDDVFSKLMEQSILAFAKSMRYGVRYLEESMPRMLNNWYDLGSKKWLTDPSNPPREVSNRIESAVRTVDALLKKREIPSHFFMSATSLLLSRVCHPHSGVSKKTIEILEQVLADYPHQFTWQIIAMFNDVNEGRKRAARSIIQGAKKRNPRSEQIIKDTLRFSEIINTLCKFQVQANGERKKHPPGPNPIKNLVPGFNINLLKLNRMKVLAPVQANLRAILPTENVCHDLTEYNVFPEHNMSYVREIDPMAHVYNSLQQPKRIILKCTNGENVYIICKGGDDLRKDSRCIEFFNLLNRILRKGSQSSARFFEITTSLVLPIHSEAGIIEMVPNCETLRSIIERLYKAERKGDKYNMHNFVSRRTREADCTAPEMYRAYMKVLPAHSPPLFPKFFLENFTEPTSWYMSRLAYARSSAIVSMGGYIIGLGDRHLDNILIDVRLGRVVHVDFNLLFHQAELLAVPETVPFRLTPNIVAALGPMGTEGNFRKYSEIAMQVMRNEKEALLTTLKPFMHDPCTEWIKDRQNKAGTKSEQDENETAKSRIEDIEKKLKGFPRSRKSRPITIVNSYSVEAQVDSLIKEASDPFNIAQMYYGWSPQI